MTLLPPTQNPDQRPHSELAATERTRAEGSQGLFGISFAGPSRAQEFLLALHGLAQGGALVLRDAVVVVKDVDGKVRVTETIDPQAGRAALSGAAWIGLLGLLFGGPVAWITGIGIGASLGVVTAQLVDLGIPDEWVRWFKHEVAPGTSTVIALAADINVGALSKEVSRFAGAKLVQTTLAPTAALLLGDALAASDTAAPSV